MIANDAGAHFDPRVVAALSDVADNELAQVRDSTG